ncbi:Uncharacterised protein [Sphingomonas paucimobilis]|nr:Uncharacterised protein [Sphingomonas paucimobilis]
MQPRLRQPGEEALLALAARLDIGLYLRALQPLQRLGQPLIGARRMVGARHREQVVRGEDEVLPHLLAALDLSRHQAGDVEDDLLVIDGRHPPRRGADLDRDIGVMIGQRLHPRGLAERGRRERPSASARPGSRWSADCRGGTGRPVGGPAIGGDWRPFCARGWAYGSCWISYSKARTLGRASALPLGETTSRTIEFVLSSMNWAGRAVLLSTGSPGAIRLRPAEGKAR